jgi:two-component system response regulator ResD
MQRILLVEDSPETIHLVKSSLGKLFHISSALNEREARELLERNAFDLILLDVVIPDGDGFRLCAELQNNDKTREIPVIFLTGKTDVSDKVIGFSVGADDYIVKPFHPLEFRARIEAKLNRIAGKKLSEQSIRKGALRVNVSFQKAFVVDGETETDVGLTPIEFKLLFYFVRNEEHVLSREQLLSVIWGDNFEVIDRTIDKHISSLRQKLGHLCGYIETVPRVGYRFTVLQKEQRRAA